MAVASQVCSSVISVNEIDLMIISGFLHFCGEAGFIGWILSGLKWQVVRISFSMS